METLVTKSCSKVTQKYHCEKCNYFTSKKSSFEKHFDTKKHKVTVSDTKVAYICENCEKKYNSRNGLWVHKKNCFSNHCHLFEKKTPSHQNNVNINELSDKDLIMMLINKNEELQNLLIGQVKEKDECITKMMDVLKNGTNNTTNTNNTNCMNNNKTFNLQFFLNETCKDAMNITDFVESIKLQLSDLEQMGEVGYIEGLSNIITSNLKIMDITERPVHCTDKKRETIYIKDDNKWEKEDDNKSKLRKIIKKIASKNYKLLPEYREKYPGCQYADSKHGDKYNKMMIEVLGGAGDNDIEKENKIIHNISKGIVINKN